MVVVVMVVWGGVILLSLKKYMFYVYGHVCAHERLNEAKLKMKHPSDIPTPRFELRW